MQTSEYILRNFRRGELIILYYSDVLKLFPHFEYNVQKSIKKYNLLESENTSTSPSYTCAIPSNLEKSFGQLYNDALTEFKFDIPISLNSNEELKCHLCNTKLKRQKVKMTKRKSDKFFFIGVDCAKQYANEEYRKSIDAEYRLLREVELNDILGDILMKVKLAEQEYKSSIYQMPVFLQNQLRESQIAVSKRTEKLKSKKQPIQKEESAVRVIEDHLTQILFIYDDFTKHVRYAPRANTYKITKAMHHEMQKNKFFIDKMLDHPITNGYLPIRYWYQVNEAEFSQDIINQLMQSEFLKHYDFQYNLTKRLYNLLPKSNQANQYGEVEITHYSFVNLLLKGKKNQLIFSDILSASRFYKLNSIIRFLTKIQPLLHSKKYELLFYSKRDHELYLKKSGSNSYYKIEWSINVERQLKKLWLNPSKMDLESILPAKMREKQWRTAIEFLLEAERREETQLIRFNK